MVASCFGIVAVAFGPRSPLIGQNLKTCGNRRPPPARPIARSRRALPTLSALRAVLGNPTKPCRARSTERAAARLVAA